MANRGLGSFVLFFTMVAINFSAFFFLGFAGEGYRIGYSYYAMMAFGTALAVMVFFTIPYLAIHPIVFCKTSVKTLVCSFSLLSIAKMIFICPLEIIFC